MVWQDWVFFLGSWCNNFMVIWTVAQEDAKVNPLHSGSYTIVLCIFALTWVSLDFYLSAIGYGIGALLWGLVFLWRR